MLAFKVETSKVKSETENIVSPLNINLFLQKGFSKGISYVNWLFHPDLVENRILMLLTEERDKKSATLCRE